MLAPLAYTPRHIFKLNHITKNQLASSDLNKEAMTKFRKKQKEIVGSYQKLAEFESGKNIERIFNRLRPKYPIRKYVDILKKMNYNGVMREATREELEKFREIDGKIFEAIKNLNKDNFKELWVDEREYERHLRRRFERGHIKSEKEYIEKIKEAFEHPYDVKWKRYTNDFKEKSNRFDRMYYKAQGFWIDIFLENGKIITAFEIDEKRYEEILTKGDVNTFELLDIPIKEIR